jgi:hypothetical protein
MCEATSARWSNELISLERCRSERSTSIHRSFAGSVVVLAGGLEVTDSVGIFCASVMIHLS